MPRYRLLLEYDGTPFTGWQAQPHAPSVQGALVEAVRKLSGETVMVRGAGRTDAGVHALGQVAHFDIAATHVGWRVRDALNHYLRPAPIAVIAAYEVSAAFDARHSAVGRQYLYRILDRRARPSLDHNRVWWVPFELDAAAMQAGAQHLLGSHDFTTFRASQCQANSALRTLERLDVVRVGAEVHIWAEARSFLHNQVRSMVGSLKCVGEGKWPPAKVATVLAARDRTRCGVVAPPEGLYLNAVSYDGDWPV
jgi:tRNA pseudouridine38-40 synthase